MYTVCLDLESVLIPEIWVTIAEATGIQELQLTTRDIPNYDVLMKQRLQVLSAHNLKFNDIQKIINPIEPFDGALTFLNWLRKHFPTIILTDCFYELVTPLVEKLAYPTIFSNFLELDKRGFINNYGLRQQNGKLETLKALKNLNFQTIAIGDSYNDVDMLQEADIGIFFNPSQKVRTEFPNFPVANSYDEIKNQLIQYTIPLDSNL
jgi:phosphoserine/homoserine phosphotransferase